jgi:hypothetical protein
MMANAAADRGLLSPSISTQEPESKTSPSVSSPTGLDASGLALGDEDDEGDGEADGDGLSANAAGPSQPRVVRKRKRNCLSCLRCHRLKVKCDKELPCGRCKSSGKGRECYYSYNKGPNAGKFPCPTPTIPASKGGASASQTSLVAGTGKPDQEMWHASHEPRGSSHWRDLMTRIGALATTKSPELAAALENVATNACLASFTLPGNFPFGTPGAGKYYSRSAVTRLIDGERSRCQQYVDRYVGLLDIVNPILDVAQFQSELDAYWDDPGGVSLCWLAQLLMVMGLGAFTTPEEPAVATEFMMAAEACLMQTPFMIRPTFDALKATCLMVIAKQVCNPTCWFTDSCWSLLGLLVRMCFIHGLPQGHNRDEDRQPANVRIARRRLWLTVIYLDLKLSMATGMPPLTRPDELNSLRTMPELGEDDVLQHVLSESLPIVLSVMVQMNSSNEAMNYEDVLQYNTQLRVLMANAQIVCANPLQRTTVDIYLRRCLMVLHQPFALHADGPTLFPESYWSSLECSLAVLMHYRELWYADFSLRHDLVGRAFTIDFFTTALQVSVHLLRLDAPLAAAGAAIADGDGDFGGHIPPRQIILDTLQSCIDIWGREQQKSICWRTAYEVLTAIIDMMPQGSPVVPK